MSEIFFIVWGVFKLEHKLDCVVYECKKRGFDLEDDLDYDDD